MTDAKISASKIDGEGLNADMVDGLHASAFAATTCTSAAKATDVTMFVNNGTLMSHGVSTLGDSDVELKDVTVVVTGADANSGTGELVQNGYSSSSMVMENVKFNLITLAFN